MRAFVLIAFLFLSIDVVVALFPSFSHHKKASTAVHYRKPKTFDVDKPIQAPSSSPSAEHQIPPTSKEEKKKMVKRMAGEYDEVAIREKIDGLIKENPVFMLSFTKCPFCLKAKSVLDGKGIAYKAVELDTEVDGNAIRAEMADMIGRTSVPAIWIGGNFIGGCNDGPMGGIVKLEESGELDPILKEVGVM